MKTLSIHFSEEKSSNVAIAKEYLGLNDHQFKIVQHNIIIWTKKRKIDFIKCYDQSIEIDSVYYNSDEEVKKLISLLQEFFNMLAAETNKIKNALKIVPLDHEFIIDI